MNNLSMGYRIQGGNMESLQERSECIINGQWYTSTIILAVFIQAISKMMLFFVCVLNKTA